MRNQFKNINNISDEVKYQIKRVKEVCEDIIGPDLTGIYIHGSLALGSFIEEKSDLDFLVVSKNRIKRSERLKLAEAFISIDHNPCPIELSIIWINDLKKENYPMICQFHYSDYWTESYKEVLQGTLESNYILDHDFDDSDIASYIPVLHQSGIKVTGEAIKVIFPIIDSAIFWEAISADVSSFEFDDYNSRYFVSNILILGRILSYKVTQRILSKYDAALWMKDYVPSEFKYIVENAIEVWFNGGEIISYDQEDLNEMKSFLKIKIQSE